MINRFPRIFPGMAGSAPLCGGCGGLPPPCLQGGHRRSGQSIDRRLQMVTNRPIHWVMVYSVSDL